MKTTHIALLKNEEGIALVTTLMLSLLLSILIAGMMFGADPNSGLYVLPEKYLGTDWKGSNDAGVAGKLSYTTGEANYLGQAEAAPYYKPGASLTSTVTSTDPTLAEEFRKLQGIPTSVKSLNVDGNLENVILSGDSTNTYPISYTVNGLKSDGAVPPNFNPFAYPYADVVSNFKSSLVNQQVGEGTVTVKAMLISVLPPTNPEGGMVTWLLKSEGKLTRGTNTTIATATVWAYMSALVTPVQGSRIVSSTVQVVNVNPGVVSRNMVTLGSNTVTIDSYRSSKGTYGAALAANSYTGQIGDYNKGSRGDVRTNNEQLIDGTYGFLNITNGVVTGNAYSTFFEDGKNGKMTTDGDWIEDGAPLLLTFPDIPAIPTPIGNTYNYATNATATLPSGNWKDLNISKGKLIIPGGTYGNLDLSSSGQVVLGTPGQTTTYNFQGFTTGSQTQILYAGPVVINVKSSLDIGGQGAIQGGSSTPASAIHWNFKGGNGEVVALHGGGDTVGVFYAPNNQLKLYGNGQFYGAIAGKSVDLNGSTKIHIDQDALLPVTTTSKVVVTTIITVGYTGSNYSLWRITQRID